MSKYIIIEPQKKALRLFAAEKFEDALIEAKLKSSELDFGYVVHGYQIAVFEYGLMHGKVDEYFRLGQQLFNGNAVMFRCDEHGETIDASQAIVDHMNANCPDVEFFLNESAVEKAITERRLVRPQSSINGEVFWAWSAKP